MKIDSISHQKSHSHVMILLKNMFLDLYPKGLPSDHGKTVGNCKIFCKIEYATAVMMNDHYRYHKYHCCPNIHDYKCIKGCKAIHTCVYILFNITFCDTFVIICEFAWRLLIVWQIGVLIFANIDTDVGPVVFVRSAWQCLAMQLFFVICNQPHKNLLWPVNALLLCEW